MGIVTADTALAQQIRHDLSELGFSTVGEGSGAEAPAAVILDCRASAPELRGAADSYSAPTICIIERRTDKTLEDLADMAGVLFYPYTRDELFIRIALAAGKDSAGQAEETFEWQGFKMDLSSYEVTIDGMRLDLTYKEFELLRCLISSPGRVFTRSQLLKTVWGYDYIEGARTVDVHIRRLRAKLGAKYGALIETVRHVGYRLTSDVVLKKNHQNAFAATGETR